MTWIEILLIWSLACAKLSKILIFLILLAVDIISQIRQTQKLLNKITEICAPCK